MTATWDAQSEEFIARVSSGEIPIPDAATVHPKTKKYKALFVQGRSRLHRFVKFRIVETNWFNAVIMIAILLNSVVLVLDTDPKIGVQYKRALEVIDALFLSIYGVEFVLKVYADPINYWLSVFNLFDFVILFLSLLQYCIEEFTTSRAGFQVLRVFRVVRVLRIMRTVRFVKGLEVLTVALWETLRQWLISTLCLVLLLIYFAAIVGHNIFGRIDPDNWGSLRDCFVSMASYVTTDGWFDRQSDLEDRGFVARSRLFAIIVIWSLNFTFSNLFVAVILMNIEEATSKYQEEEAERKAKILRHKKELMTIQQRDTLKQLMQFQKKGKYLNFQQMVAEFELTLKHEDIIILPDLCTNIVWLETYILTMENMANTLHSVQQFHFEMANILTKALELNLSSKYGLLDGSNF